MKDFWEFLELDWEGGFDNSSNSTGKEVFDEHLELDWDGGFWEFLVLHWEWGFERSSNSTGKEIFKRAMRSETGNNDKIWNPRGRDSRHVPTAGSEIREAWDSQIREGDGEQNSDIAWDESSLTLGTHYASAA